MTDENQSRSHNGKGKQPTVTQKRRCRGAQSSYHAAPGMAACFQAALLGYFTAPQ